MPTIGASKTTFPSPSLISLPDESTADIAVTFTPLESSTVAVTSAILAILATVASLDFAVINSCFSASVEVTFESKSVIFLLASLNLVFASVNFSSLVFEDCCNFSTSVARDLFFSAMAACSASFIFKADNSSFNFLTSSVSEAI
ncbi:unannotated protein [freshwater metagenome]|uniref:Unannotated protein n=1 Tax=freshwater metagenome TaxID=449393 RepID=A0A6J6WSF9_9ZZZZ